MKNIKITADERSNILKKIDNDINNYPQEVSVNVILKGESARKFHIVKTILSNVVPELDSDDIDKFILRSGVEREIVKLATIWDNE